MNRRLYVCSNCATVFALEYEPQHDCRLVIGSVSEPGRPNLDYVCGGGLMLVTLGDFLTVAAASDTPQEPR